MKKLYNILHVIFLYIFLISIYFTSADIGCSCRKSGSGDKKENEENNSECCCKRRKEFNSKSMPVIKEGDQKKLNNLEKKSIDNNKKQMLKDRNLQKYKTGKGDNNLKERNNIKIDFVNNVGNDEEMLHNTREKYTKLIENKYDFLLKEYEISIQLCKDVDINTEFTSYYNLILNARNLEELEQRKKEIDEDIKNLEIKYNEIIEEEKKKQEEALKNFKDKKNKEEKRQNEELDRMQKQKELEIQKELERQKELKEQKELERQQKLEEERQEKKRLQQLEREKELEKQKELEIQKKLKEQKELEIQKELEKQKELEENKKNELLEKQNELDLSIQKISSEYKQLKELFFEKENAEEEIIKAIKDVEEQIKILSNDNCTVKYNEINNKIEGIKAKITKEVYNQITKYFEKTCIYYTVLIEIVKNVKEDFNKYCTTFNEVEKNKDKYNFDSFKKTLSYFKRQYELLVNIINSVIQSLLGEIEKKCNEITKCITKVKASYEEISNKGNDLSKKIDKIDVNINDKSIYEKRKEYINFLNSSSSKFYVILQNFVKEYKTYSDEYGNYHKEYIVKEKNKDIITKCKKLNEYKTIFIYLSEKIESISKEIDNIKLHIEVKENELLKDINNNFNIMKKKVAYISALENIIEEIILPNKELFGLESLKFLFDNRKDKNNKNTEKVDNRYEELSNKMKEKFGKPLKDINEIDVYETVGKLYNEITYNISDIYQATTMSKIEKIMNYSSYIFSIGKKEKITIAEKKLYDPIKSIEVPNNLTIGGIKSFVTSTFQIFDDFVKLIEDDIKTNENKSRSLLVDIGTKISKYKKSQTDYLENIKVKINESKENLREFVKTFIEVFDYVTKNNFPINGNDYEDYKSLCEILEKKSKETDDIFEILTDKEIYRNDEDLIVLACDTIKNVEFIEKFFDDVLFYFYDVRTKIYKKINEENNKEVKIKKKEDFMKYFENNQINLEYFKNLYEKMNEELKKYNIV